MVHRGETNQRGLVGESPLGQVEAPTEAGVRPAPGLEACGVDGVGRGSRSARGQGWKRGWVGTGGVDTERTLSPQETADPPSRRSGPLTPGSSPPGPAGLECGQKGTRPPLQGARPAQCASPATSSLFIHALLSFLGSPLPLSFFLLTAVEDGGGIGGAHALRLRTHLPLPPPHRWPEASLHPSLDLTFPVYSVYSLVPTA